MKILLIEPPIDSWNRLGRHYLPNPGTLAIGTYLKYKGHSVKLIDAYAEGIRWKDVKRYVKSEASDIVGMSSYTADIYGRIMLARMIKEVDPRIRVVMGGAHITLASKETLLLGNGAIDHAILGEGELSFLELVEAIARGDDRSKLSAIAGTAHLQDGQYIEAVARPLIENLDTLPFPDYSLLPMHKYRNSYFPYPAEQGFSCSFSRGCVQRCVFCAEAALWKYHWRGRSAEKIVEEMGFLNRKYHKRAFLLGDDDFLYDRERNLSFIERMLRAGLQIEFRAGARMDTLLRNKDILVNLRKVGMTSLQVGVESCDQTTLDQLKKNNRLEQLEEVSSAIKEAGIPLTSAFFIIGNANDDKNIVGRIVAATKKYHFATLQTSALTPWPGTGLFNDLKNTGKLKDFDYRNYNFKRALLGTDHLTRKEVQIFRWFVFIRWWFDLMTVVRSLREKHTRHLYRYTMLSIFPSGILYALIHTFKLWKFFEHNRRVDAIHMEHQSLLLNERETNYLDLN